MIEIYKSSDAVSIGPGVKMTIFPIILPCMYQTQRLI